MRWSTFSFAGVNEVMGIGLVPATEAVLARNRPDHGRHRTDRDQRGVRDAVLAFLDDFKIADDDPRVNPWGGAIAPRYPLASSGVRLMIQLAREFAGEPASATA